MLSNAIKKIKAAISEIFVWGRTAFWLAVIFSPVILVVSCVVLSLNTPPDEATLQKREATGMIYAAKETVKDSLKDPDSVQFGEAFYTGKAVCGFVNAKNGFGGYTGMKRYIVIGPLASFEDNGKQFDALWRKACLPEGQEKKK